MAIGGRTRSTRGLVIVLVTASLVTITIDYRQGSSGPLSRLSDGIHSVVEPLQNGVSTVFRPIAAFFTALWHLPSLEQQNKELRTQIQELQTDKVRTETAIKELNDLQALLGVAKSYDFETKGADVIGNGVSNFEWTIDIDKGSNDGIKADMPVISAQGLVGRVVHVTPFGSQVLLIPDFNSREVVRLVRSQETGLLEGQGRGDLALSSIDQSTEVEVGEPVITSGYSGGLYPQGIPVGSVSAVDVDSSTGAKEIHVAPYVDFSTLGTVLVVTSFDQG